MPSVNGAVERPDDPIPPEGGVGRHRHGGGGHRIGARRAVKGRRFNACRAQINGNNHTLSLHAADGDTLGEILQDKRID